jgi:uncharacterized protein GlcG (DUF336 family)
VETFLERAQRAVEEGLAYAAERGLRMTVLVMDLTGTPAAAARMDGSRTITYEIALAKANTAREFQNSTAVLKEQVLPANQVAIGQLGRHIAFLGGGLPIIRDGELLGAIGTSGGNESQDIECAEACLAAFGGSRPG